MTMIFSGNPRPRVTWSKVNQADVVGEGESLELREVGRHISHHLCHHRHHHRHHHDDERYLDTTRGSTSAVLATEWGRERSARFTSEFYVSFSSSILYFSLSLSSM